MSHIGRPILPDGPTLASPVPSAQVPDRRRPGPSHGGLRWRRAAIALAFLLGTGVAGHAVAPTLGFAFDARSTSAVNVNGAALAMRGYDPVSAVEDGRAERGSPRLAWWFDGAEYRFASAAHLAAFRAAPQRFVPAYGGFAAEAVAAGHKADADPRAFTVHGGRLYLHHDAAGRDAFRAALPDSAAAADTAWPRIRYATPRALTAADGR
jgi:hypothetical protein